MTALDNDELRSLITMGIRSLREVTLPEDSAGMIEQYRQLDELISAVDTVRTRVEVAVVLSRVPGATSGMWTSPMASEALDRLRRPINVIAHRDT
jgi:hypothetical protein